jgi:hypothetical protein
MRRDGSLRPTENGVGLAKDVWMLGIAAGLSSTNSPATDNQL